MAKDDRASSSQRLDGLYEDMDSPIEMNIDPPQREYEFSYSVLPYV